LSVPTHTRIEYDRKDKQLLEIKSNRRNIFLLCKNADSLKVNSN
jgi:hypothetical protein